MSTRPKQREESHRKVRVETYPDVLKSPGLLARILDIADDAIISIDSAQRICIFNQGAERIFGYATDEVLGESLGILLPPEHRERHERHVGEFAKSPIAARVMAQRAEIFGVRKNGDVFPAEASISKVDVHGELILTVILRDITSRKTAERKVQEALQEKEVLLREVHHRVKNNLQVVSSLLSLQARSTTDPHARKVFEESQGRVQSMALIHEQLYESNSFAAVDFSNYLRQLAAQLVRSQEVSADRVDVKVEVDGVQLSIDVAVPCGLIVNELLTNALKYAFPEGRNGSVRIRVSHQPDASVTLTVSDDGVGLPPGVGFWNTKTLGLRLVRSLVRQLDGEIELSGPPGASFRIRFAPGAS